MNQSAPPPQSGSKGESSAPALWRQLQATAVAVAKVRAGQSGSTAFAEVEPALRPGVQALGFAVMRQLGRAEALRRLLVKRNPPPAADALLCSALALCWREADARYDAFTLVDQTVEAAKRNPATRPQASFINACLRRFLRERDALVSTTDRDLVARWNHPRWWIDDLRADHPKTWETILEANNQQAPLTVRVNQRKVPFAQYQQALSAINLEAKPVASSGLELAFARPVLQLPGFSEGWCSVQDAAAQLAAPLLLDGLTPSADGQPLRVLDACAAPGGKTAHLLEIAKDGTLEVLAIEQDARRADRIGDTLSRLGLQANAQVRVADAAQPASWWDGQPFDAVLLDAPCTASGIVRRHPDIRWLRRDTDVAELASQQAALLAALWPVVRPGGRLLYCTCSVFKAEGPGQIDAFLAHHTDARLLPSPGLLLPQMTGSAHGVPENTNGAHDGFFYALLERLQ